MNRSFQNTRRTSAGQAPAGWVSTDRIPASPDRISASQVLADASPDIEKQPEPERKGIFTGISPVQIAATALAALTSMFFSSIIGFTGSVIGVALGSIVSTVSTQVYKNTIAKSADKVKEKATGVFGPDGKTEVLPGIGLAGSDPAETVATARSPYASTLRTPGAQSAQEARDAQGTKVRRGMQDAYDAQRTRVLHGESGAMPSSDTPDSALPPMERSAAQSHSARTAALRATRISRANRAKTERGVVIVAIASGLIAIALSAFIIFAVTEGKGIGEKSSVSDAVFGTASDTPATEQSDTGSSNSQSDSKESDTDKQSAANDDSSSTKTGSNADSTADSNSNASASNKNGSSADASSGAGDANAGSNGSSGTNGSGSSGSDQNASNGNGSGSSSPSTDSNGSSASSNEAASGQNATGNSSSSQSDTASRA
ncbi:hypothetical protein [Slackia exigua]|uniref:hypothetical protein n=1 Tax=Slackia exigua TaxID=84109 RepID=UPI0023F2E290|nr:hypothetical protein [Slackia exigua]